MIADGLVRPGELRLLEGVRKQLGISEREHQLILARLTEEERHLFEEGAARGVEAHAQLEGYQVALAEAMLRPAREEEIDELRRSFGVSAGDHQEVLARVRGASGELLSRARRQLERARELSRGLAALGATEPTAPRVFLCYLLARARDESLDRFLELLEVAGDGPVIQSLRRRLFASDPAEREPALRVLALACPGADELVRELEPLVAGRSKKDAAEPDRDGEVPALARLLEEANPFLRAGAVWAAARHPEKILEARLALALEDEHPLVRETATRFVGVSPDASGERPVGLASIETMHFLHAAPFFADLDPADLYDLSQFTVEEMVVPPATICEAGDPGADALFVLVGGRAAVVGRGPGDPAGAERPIAMLGRGEIVGELSVLDGSPRSTTVRPEGGPVHVLRIPGPRLRGILLQRPRAAQALLGMLAGRMRRLVQQAASA
jgi:hypothetical protein